MDQISEDLKKKYHISTKTDLEKTSIFNRIRNTISRFFIRTKSLTSEDRESISQKITDIRENDDKIFEYDFNENIVSALENEINNMEIADNDFLRDNWMQGRYYILESIGMKSKADELRKIEDKRREEKNEKNNSFKESIRVDVSNVQYSKENRINEIQRENIKPDLNQEDNIR